MKNVRVLKSQAGFSLVELMVVVAIIGILASLAIPSVGKYMAKARQSEAKTQLSSFYTAEKAFFAEYSAYHSAFGALGYSPEGKLRYVVGFDGPGNPADGTNGYTTFAQLSAAQQNVNTYVYCGVATAAGGIGASGCSILQGANGGVGDPTVPGASNKLDKATFLAAASAIIYSGGTVDSWTVDQNKDFKNTAPGIP